MYTVTKTMYTETAHRLVGHPGLCSNIHGHSYKWEVSISAPDLSPNSMVMDFSNLKSRMAEAIDRVYDHAIVLQDHPENAELLYVLANMGMRVVTTEQAPTAEEFARLAQEALSKGLPRAWTITVSVWETTTSKAEYSHD